VSLTQTAPGCNIAAAEPPLAPGRPTADRAVRLFREVFLNRADGVLCHLASWGKPCPAEVDDLDAAFRAHVLGPPSPPARVRWRAQEKNGEATGHFRLGTYTPGPDSMTRWLVLDFDGGPDHAAALADPLAVALSVQALAARVGLRAYLERSGGGHGWHLWMFFQVAQPAAQARALGLLLAPRDALSGDGFFADPRTGTGIEVFPKSAALKEGGVGNPVWLPWFYDSNDDGNCFYTSPADGFEPYVMDDFERNTDEAVARAVEMLNQDHEEG
jgi:hypothetical protein